MLGIELSPELILQIILFVPPLGFVLLIISILIISICNSRSKRRLKQRNEAIMSHCTKCGKEVAAGGAFCRNCGDQLSNIQSGIQSTPVSSVITDQEYDSFIENNADKYLTKFKKFNSGGTDSFLATWHWPAFFVPFFWMLYRKLYLWALLVFVLAIMPIFAFPYLMILFGITANYIYYKHTKKKLLKIKLASSSSDVQKAANIAHQGGVNKIAVILAAIMAIAFLGLIAAIAIPQFTAMKTRGYCASAKADLKNAYIASQSYFSDHPKGKINNVDDLKSYGFQKPDKVLVHVKGTANSLLISANNPGCDKTYFSDPSGKIKEEIKP